MLVNRPIKVAVVGVGYFGAFHCGKIADLPGVELAAVVDIDRVRGGEVARRHRAELLSGHHQLAGKVDAAVVAVPTTAHHAVAADLLREGLSLLVEKPLATTVAEADHLVRLAEDGALRLQVGHLERYNPVFIEARSRISKPRYIRMERTGPFPGRGADVDVVLELMTHDLDILLQLATSPVEAVTASGYRVMTEHLDVATARIRFRDGLLAELVASRASPRRVRRFMVLDARGVLEVDLAERTIVANRCDAPAADPEDLMFETGDPLLDQDRDFVDVLQNGRPPRVSATAGRDAVALAARILDSMDPERTR